MEIFLDQDKIYLLPTIDEKPIFIEFEGGVITYDLSNGNTEFIVAPYLIRALWKYKYRPLMKIQRRPPSTLVGRRKINGA